MSILSCDFFIVGEGGIELLLKALIVSIGLAMTWASEVGAQGDISITTEVDKAFITIGEEFHYEIKITHDPEIKLGGRISTHHLRPFRSKEARKLDAKNEGGRTVEGWRYTLTAYRLGDYLIESVPVPYERAAGARGELHTTKIYI